VATSSAWTRAIWPYAVLRDSCMLFAASEASAALQ
jgi:hypothetical protein